MFTSQELASDVAPFLTERGSVRLGVLNRLFDQSTDTSNVRQEDRSRDLAEESGPDQPCGDRRSIR